MDQFEGLEQKGLVHIFRETTEYRGGGDQFSFGIRGDVVDDLLKEDYKRVLPPQNLSINEFFIHIEKLCEERIQKSVSYRNTLQRMTILLQNNEHLGFVKKINELSLNKDETLVLLRFFHYTVTVNAPIMIFAMFRALYDHDSDFSLMRQQLINGNYVLIKNGLIENTCENSFGKAEKFQLTESAKEEFLVELNQGLSLMPIKGLKNASEIIRKNLFYPEKIQRAIDELGQLLQSEKFQDVQKRLSENGMRTGFACLFSGGPGTGKTETVYQIARQTGRGIMQVDISNTKSMWFGESEKKIKDVFTRYRSAVKRAGIVPILFFNEADAVIGKRQTLGENRNGPGQTENAIQNIILQEIENLNGILIAATNLANNMDAAFERRFLYKIEFEKPNSETRKAIWEALMPDIAGDTAQELASRFDFSGGQIENITRKVTVHQVLHGVMPSSEDIVRFCNEEHLNQGSAKKIGFKA
jgi:hypothetical protein